MKIKELANLMAQLMVQSAAILNSNYICMFLYSERYQYPNLDSGTMNRNLRTLLADGFKPILGKQFQHSMSNAGQVANALLAESRRLSLAFGFPEPIASYRDVSLAELEMKAFQFGMDFFKYEADLNFYKSVLADHAPAYYPLCANAVKSLAYFCSATENLRKGIPNPVLSDFIAQLRSDYISGDRFQNIHSVLVNAVHWLRESPYTVLQFSTLFPREDRFERGRCGLSAFSCTVRLDV